MNVKSILSLYLNHCGLDSQEVQGNYCPQTPLRPLLSMVK